MEQNTLEPFLDSWELALEAENKAARTIGNYRDGVSLFDRWLAEQYPDIAPADVTAGICREWIGHIVTTRSPSTGRTRWAALRQFWAWMTEEREVEFNPMENVRQPAVVDPEIEVLTPEQVRAVFATCQGPSLIERRDQAIIHLFGDTPVRVTALATARLEDLDLRGRQLRVVEKGSKVIVLPFGLKAARALDRYLRARVKDSHAGVSTLFYSTRDGRPLNRNSILLMLRRRGQEAGVEGLRPHLWRHTFADRWLRAGGAEGDLMELTGWTSRDMLGRYAKATRAERAREAHARLSPVDNMDP